MQEVTGRVSGHMNEAAPRLSPLGVLDFVLKPLPPKAYIHAVGTVPHYRGQGLGRCLYHHFFEVVSNLGCAEVLSITSPVN